MPHPVATAALFGLALATSLLGQEPALDPAAAGPADRIWSANPDDPELWLRRAFALPEKVTSARLVFSCDNECRAFVNGREVGSNDSWMDVTVVELEKLGRENTLAFAAKNTGGPGAFACWLLWTDADGSEQALVSDATWRISTTPVDGWEAPAFDDSRWETATPNFTTTFGLNLYNGEPSQVRWKGRYGESADAIQRGLTELQRARTREAAHAALDAIERAVMAVRAALAREAAAEKARDGGR
jgi:Arc/MetJ-type ribon-helix-helix transcriptional regulator